MRAYSEWGSEKVIIDKSEPTHYVRNCLVLRTIKRYSKKYNIKDICEIGCGTGSLSIKLGKSGFRVDAYDLDKNAVYLAKKFNSYGDVGYSSGNVLKLKNSKKYDMVVAVEVLEHIKDDTNALSKISDMVKDNGLLLITVPIHEKYRKEFDNRSGHIRRYNSKDLIVKIRKSGFNVVYTRHFNYPFLWLWYFYIYLPYSDKKEEKMLTTKEARKKLPKIVWVLNIFNKCFLIDLFFNSKKYSTNLLVVGKKAN